MSMDKRIAEEGADWIAEMVSEDLGGFVPAELVDLVMEFEHRVRQETGDEQMGHHAMTERLVLMLEEDGVPVKEGAVTPTVIEEILHWEDEFLAMAGQPRTVRPS